MSSSRFFYYLPLCRRGNAVANKRSKKPARMRTRFQRGNARHGECTYEGSSTSIGKPVSKATIVAPFSRRIRSKYGRVTGSISTQIWSSRPDWVIESRPSDKPTMA